jgi:hypothetical protein
MHKRFIVRGAKGFIKGGTVGKEGGEVEMQQKQNKVKQINNVLYTVRRENTTHKCFVEPL